MAWQTPKTDWAPEDGVMDIDFNRIENNIQDLHERSNILSPYILTKDLVLYVDGSGNDATGNGSASAPYKTINKALSVVPHNLSGHSVIISIDAGTYPEIVEISGYSGTIVLSGNSGALVTVNGFRVSGADVEISNIILAVSSGVFVTNGGTLTGDGAMRISGNSLTVNYGALFNLSSLTISNASGYAVEVNRGGRFFATTLSGTNVNGIRCQTGGIAGFGTNGFTITGTQYMTATGGRIYSDSQYSIPEF